MFHFGVAHIGRKRALPGSGALAGLLLVSAVSGCDSKPKGEGQVAAEVNGTEITIHEVNRRLVNLEVGAEESVPALKREILDELIDRALLVQRATEAKLDRDPEIMRAMEQAREAILADALVNRKLAQLPEATAEQVQSFRDAHPELFRKRRIYSLEQFTIARGDFSAALGVRLQGVRTAGELERALRDGHIAYVSETVNQAAEQLPMALAGRLLAASRGDVVTFTAGDEAQLVYVQDFREDAIDDQQAEVNIREYLRNVEKQRLIDETTKSLRQKAKVRYFGEFEKTAVVKAAPAAPNTPGERGGGKEALPAHVERGVSGLLK